MARRDLVRGQRCELELSRLAPSGDAVGLHPSGLEVHVPDALPGERARVRIEHVSRQAPRAGAVLEQLLAPSPDRRPAPCRHQGRCSGCPLMIANEPAQRGYKRELLRQSFGFEVAPLVHLPEAELGYRWSSKRVVGGKAGRIVLGSYHRGTHRLADMNGCLVDAPAIAACADELAQVASELGVTPHRGEPRPRQLRYAWLKTDGRGQVLLCLVTAAPDRELGVELARRLTRPSGVWLAVQASDGNALRGQAPELVAGRAELEIELDGSPRELARDGSERALGLGAGRLAVGPVGFLQPNPRATALAYHDLLASPDGRPLGGDIALDLYAGAGATTRLLRRRFAQVLCCDADPESAAQLGVAPEPAEHFLERLVRRQGLDGALSAFAGAEPRAIELAVADPPRAGLGPPVCGWLGRLRPRQLHLMSCNPAALARDLGALCQPTGGFELRALRAYDTLPQTPHVELVAWLEARAC